jgi:lysophospholipase L1-like esterase
LVDGVTGNAAPQGLGDRRRGVLGTEHEALHRTEDRRGGQADDEQSVDRADGFWARALALKPTYMLIGFGGNDVPGKGPERETDPKTTFYANMKQYVEEARAAGIRPILVTPMELRKYDKDGKLMHSYDDYAAATRKVGEDTHTPVIDLYKRSTAFLETLTQAQADTLNHIDPTQPKVIDRGHINRTGSEIIGGFVAEDLKTAVPALAKSIRVQPNGPVVAPSR